MTGDPDIDTFPAISKARLRHTQKTHLPPRVGVLDSGRALRSVHWGAVYSIEASRPRERMIGNVQSRGLELRGVGRAFMGIMTDWRDLLIWALSERVLGMEGPVLDEHELCCYLRDV